MQKSYEVFVEELRQVLLAALGIEETEVRLEKKGGRFKEGKDRLLIAFAEHEETKEVCALYPEELYGNYRNGATIEEMVREILRDILEIKAAGLHERARMFLDYEQVKGELFIRLLNADRNEELLQDAVYKTLGDVALVLYAKVGETKGCITSTMIQRNLIEIWKKDSDEVFKEALLNTYFVNPPRIYRWEQMIFDPDYEGDNFMDMTGVHTLKKDALGNCLSTLKKTNGAVAVFLPGVAERLCQLLDGDFYIAFTSIHEAMIHDDRSIHPADLKNILEDTLKNSTPEEDFLSSRIYHYCRDSRRFSCILD